MLEIEKSIEEFYLKFLGRLPDNVGLDSYVKRFQAGMSLDEIRKEIQTSVESQIFKMKIYEHKDTNFSSSLSQKDIQKIFNENEPWYHWIKINNIESKKTRTSKIYQMWIIQNLPYDFTDKSVLDIGCADGYYSFLAESRNAKKIVAIDSESFDVGKTNLFASNNNPNRFQTLKNLLNSKIEYKKLDIYDIDELGQQFDYVFMYGLYYHLQDFILALRKVSSIVKESVFLSGHILDSGDPIMYYYPLKTEQEMKQIFSPIVASPSCLINIAKYFCNFKDAVLVDSITMDYGESYPHNHGQTMGKIGLFKFSK